MYDKNEFLELYKKLESWARIRYYKENEKESYYGDRNYKRYPEEGVYALEKNCENRYIKFEAQYFRYVRNVLTHHSCGDETPFILLTDAFKERFERFCSYLMDNISSIYIPVNEIYMREMYHKIIPTISVMKQKSFSYVPVMNGKKIWGVFSESALFDFIGDGNAYNITENMQLMNMQSYITKYSENGSYDFVGEDTTIEDVRDIFTNAINNGRRLDVLYVTTTGDQDGDLVGLISIWDISTLQ